jgi:hypothetical protein
MLDNSIFLRIGSGSELKRPSEISFLRPPAPGGGLRVVYLPGSARDCELKVGAY